AESDRLVEQANVIYDRTITEARQEQQRMLSESEVVRIADEEASRIRDAAHAESDRRREECDAYIDDKMARFEEFLGSTLRTVSRGREELHGVAPIGRREAHGRRGAREGDHYGDGYGDY
ncbi:DivIVA domain-containing protein, partial [Dietzia sp. DQ11-38-2]|nr:DivIVA domain-containing protein [Dietzia sp. DQ11-38-2]